MSDAPVRVLLVEDNPADAALLGHALADSPNGRFELRHVGRLADAVEALRKDAFDVCLLDLSLPDSVGLRTVTAARAAAPAAPIVVLTGLADDALGMAALEQGAQDYLVKGQTESRLLVRAMRYAIQRKQAQLRQEQHLRRMNLLIEVSRQVLAETTTHGLIQRVVDAARALTGARAGVCGHGYRDGAFHASATSLAEDRPPCPKGEDFRIERGGIYMELIRERTSIRLSDAELRSHPAWRGLAPTHGPLRGLLGASLIGVGAEPVGLIMVTDKEGGEDFIPEDEALLNQLASVASLGLQHIHAREQAEDRAAELDAVFNSMVDAVVIYDATGRPVRANAAAIASYGLDPASADDRTIQDRLAITRPSGQPIAPEDLPSRRALRGETVVGDTFQFTDVAGRRLTIRASASPLLAEGKATGAVAVWHDTTEHEQLLTELRRARDELEARVQERTADLRDTVNELQDEVAQRLRAENALRESSEVLERIFSTTHLLMAYMDADFNFIRANRMYAQADGREPDFFPGRNHFQLYPNAENEEIFRQVVRSGQPFFIFEKPFVYAHDPQRGTSYWDWSLVPVKDTRGKVEGLILSLLDVTERHKTQDALRESEERFRQMAESVPEVFWMASADLKQTLYVNPAFEKIWGRPCQELYDDPGLWLKSVHPEDRPHLEAGMRESERSPHGTFDREFRIVRPDRTVRLIRTRAFPIRDEQGMLHRLCGISEDITESRQAEEARIRLAAIVEASRDAIIGEGLDGTITSWSAGAERMYGYSAKEAIGKPIAMLVPPERRAEMPRILQTVRQGERAENLDTLRLRKDRRRIDVSVTVSPVRDHSGAVTGASVIVRDVTEYRRLQKEILRISEMERNRIGHDLHDTLGQVLTGVSFMCEVLQQKLTAKASPEARDVQQIATLVGESVQLSSQLARGLCPVEVTGEGLTAALKELADRTQSQFRLTCSFNSDIPVIVRDDSAASQLYLIAQEAVNNAVKHAKARQIAIEFAESRDIITLSVKDDGVGLPRRVEQAKGMGLRIMGYRAGVIGASLRVENAPSGGTQVVCTLDKAAASPS